MAIEVDVDSSTVFTEDKLVSRTNPFLQFRAWLTKAQECDQIPEANAVCLSTSTKDGKPSSRMMLMKTYTESGFTFFTNHESRKGKELEENPNATLLFHWPQIRYTVRIEGTMKKVSEKDSMDSFHSLPKANQATIVVSNQSHEISSRDELVARQREVLEKYQGEDQVIPKPAHWREYILSPTVFEFYCRQSAYLDDRIVFTKDTVAGSWSIKRLAPRK